MLYDLVSFKEKGGGRQTNNINIESKSLFLLFSVFILLFLF